MSKVLITRSKIDDLATSISAKSGETLPLTLDEMKDAVDGIQTGGTSAISVVDTLDSHGGTVRTITALDISDTTAVASDVLNSKWFYTAQGVKTQGTASGGGGATQHVIHLEFTDSTDTDIDVFYDDPLIGTMITAYEPATYSGKTVTLAELDGVAWYEPANIPIGVQLIDFTKATNDYVVGSNGQVVSEQWYAVSDYTVIDSSMSFTAIGCRWFYIGFYDENKSALGALYINNISGTVLSNDNLKEFYLNSLNIPSASMYCRISTVGNPGSSELSLIRTA